MDEGQSKQEAELGIGYAGFLVALGSVCCPETLSCLGLQAKFSHLWPSSVPGYMEGHKVYPCLQGFMVGGCGPCNPVSPNQLSKELKGKSGLTGLSS